MDYEIVVLLLTLIRCPFCFHGDMCLAEGDQLISIKFKLFFLFETFPEIWCRCIYILEGIHRKQNTSND